MNERLQILIIEDSENDALLILRQLRAAKIDPAWQRVDSSAALAAALEKQIWDAVLCDYSLPEFTAAAALAMVRRKDPDIPFIIVSGVIGEEAAVQMLKAGATDYVIKDRLERLPSAIEREIREAENARSRRLAEELLRQSEQRYREIFERASDPIFIVDITPAGRFEFSEFNPAEERMTGLRTAQVRGKYPEDVLPPDVAAAVTERYRRCVATGTQVRYDEELRLPGGYVISDTTLIPVKDATGAVVRLIGLGHDITERTMLQDQIREKQRRLELAVQAGNIGLWEHNLMTGAVWHSPELKQQLGYAADEPTEGAGMWEQFTHPDDWPVVKSAVDAYLRDPRETLELTYRLRHKSGAWRWIIATANVCRDEQGVPVRLCGTHIDITLRRELEDRLLHAHKMEGVGRLAGGIAHDFNNLLSVILGFSEIADVSFQKRLLEQANEAVQEIKKAAWRGNALTGQLLAFCGNQHLCLAEVSLNRIVTGLTHMLQRLIGEDIRLETQLAPDVPMVMADRVQVEQVIMSLAANAREAMPQGGGLTIATETVAVSEDDARRAAGAHPGTFVRVTFRDTGAGIDAATISHLFEPFSAPARAGVSAGMGLAVNNGIIQQHGGWIGVSSAPGAGTAFMVYLPVTLPASATASLRSEPAHPVRAGAPAAPRVLVVEDEDGIRKLVCRILRDEGYTAVDAPSAEAARALFERDEGAFDVLFSDSVLPGMSGVQLAHALQAIKPSLKVLISSGYLDDKAQWPVIKERGYGFLRKPYAPHELVTALKELLSS